MRPVYLFALALAVGCATPGTSGSSDPSAPRQDPNVISQQELSSVPASNLYDLVEKLRPNFLRARGQTSISLSGSEYPTVYLDGRSYGDLASLRSIIPNQVRQVRYYSSADAAARFGMQNSSGVIDVTSR
jgi:hypothetical protein